VLSLRASVPGHLTERVIEVLDGAEGVTGLAVVRGASLAPEGDVVTADVAREGANAVVDALRDLGVHEAGTIRLDPVGTWISERAYRAEKEAPGASADAVVWAAVEHEAYEESELNWTYLSFMTLATAIAGVAIIEDSPILVVGAMVLGPEFGPIAAIGMALVGRRWHLLRLATRTLLLGFAAAILLVLLAGLLARAVGWLTYDDVVRDRTQTAFIDHPNQWSLVVAVVAAAAGVLSLTSGRTTNLAGVFISVTTVPAAGNIALGLAVGAWDEVWRSGAQLGINIAGMAVAGWLTLRVQQAVWSRVRVRRPRMVGRPPQGGAPGAGRSG
jgi:uncharacterized hydrophobic protein (TIGR00271 family)